MEARRCCPRHVGGPEEDAVRIPSWELLPRYDVARDQPPARRRQELVAGSRAHVRVGSCQERGERRVMSHPGVCVCSPKSRLWNVVSPRNAYGKRKNNDYNAILGLISDSGIIFRHNMLLRHTAA
eukprot:COSAG03_NODE_14597_length_458_cov_2.022284_1_plen_125_part_00